LDFSKVLITDNLATSFFAVAEKEGLLYSRTGEKVPVRRVSGAILQRILSLIVLFDKIIVHDSSGGEFRVPDLERDGIFEIVSTDEPIKPVSPLPTKWRRGIHGSRGRPPKALMKSLRLMEDFRDIVVSSLCAHRIDFNKHIAKMMGYSYQKYIETFIEYATSYAMGDDQAISTNPLNRIFKDEELKYMEEELFDYSGIENGLSPINATLLMASIIANEFATIINLSKSMGIGVATGKYEKGLRSIAHKNDTDIEIELASKRYVTLRSVLAEQKGVMPNIEGIRHALKLRNNPYLKAMRSEIFRINSAIIEGHRDILIEASREFDKASKFLNRRQQLNRALKFLTIMSVPVTVIEALLGASPIAGLSIASLSTCGMQVSNRMAQKGEWILFG
jgi:hypothetical protein